MKLTERAPEESEDLESSETIDTDQNSEEQADSEVDTTGKSNEKTEEEKSSGKTILLIVIVISYMAALVGISLCIAYYLNKKTKKKLQKNKEDKK